MDIRVTNTQNRIQNALIECIQEKSLIRLYDKEIIEKAEVSSRTFYKYYSDKNDVLAEAEKIVITDYRKAINEDMRYWHGLKHSPSKKDVMALSAKGLDNFLACFKKYKIVVEALTSDNGDPSFSHEINNILAERIKKLIIYYFGIYHQEGRVINKEIPFNLIAMRYAQSVINPIEFWLENEDYLSTQQVKNLIGENILYSPYELTTHSLGN